MSIDPTNLASSLFRPGTSDRTAPPRRRRPSCQAMESLEQRRMMSVTYNAASATVSLNGTAGNDTFTVSRITNLAGTFTRVMEGMIIHDYNVATQPVLWIGAGLGAGNDSVSVADYLDIPLNANGGDGYDTISGGAGKDTIVGGNQTDWLYGNDGEDSLDGQANNDRIEGGLGNDTIYGQIGDDTLKGDDGDDLVLGGDDSDDLIYGGVGSDTLNGEEGNDTIYGEDGQDGLFGEEGNDSLDGGDMKDSLYGGENNDTLLGGENDDYLSGYSGDDSLDGGNGNDRADAGEGRDTILGGDGLDTLHGDEGNDSLDGGSKDDFVHGDENNDTVHGGGGNDRLFAGSGTDRLEGDGGDDVLVSIDVDLTDTIYGNAGFDSFWVDQTGAITDTLSDASVNERETNVHGVHSFANGADLTLDGDSIADPTGGAAYANYSAYPLFGTGGPVITDINQGDVNDCWLLSSLATAVNQVQNVIVQLVADLGDGTYAVQINNDVFRVDGDLAYDGDYYSLQYAGFGNDDCIWVGIVEKAWALHKSGDYSSLDNDSPWGPLGKIGGENRTIWNPWGNSATILSSIDVPFVGAVACSQLGANSCDVLENSHIYAITDVQYDADGNVSSVTLYNPWGYDGGTLVDSDPDDGFVTLTVDQFEHDVQNFGGVLSADFSSFT